MVTAETVPMTDDVSLAQSDIQRAIRSTISGATCWRA
jgi:hypothetical protein